MAQLDRFLAALTEYRAEALVLEQDKAPAFRFLSGTKTVSKQVLDPQRILALIAELSGREVLDAFRDGGTASFLYKTGTTTYSGVLEQDSGSIVATLWEMSKAVGVSETSFAEVAERIASSVPAADTHGTHDVPAPPREYAYGPGSNEHATVQSASPRPAPTNDDRAPRVPPTLPSLDGYQLDLLVPDDLPPNYRQRLEALLRAMVEKRASDLHLCCDHAPVYRIDGRVHTATEHEPFAAEELFRMLFSITPQRNREQFLKHHDTDFAYAIEGVSRYRANLFFDRRGPGAVFRAIPERIMPIDELGLGDTVKELAKLNKGLVLVTGPTGSGKSTTLASLLDLVNETRRDHIITIEDPIEFVHPAKNCLVNQRQVGVHTDGFKAALRAALREDPDVILVGELRDLETVEMAIETAETGHLVFGTLHTTTAASTIDRIIDQFPADRQAQIRVMLSESLRAVIAQTLLPRKGGGRVAAHEILVVNASVSNLIREGKTFQIESQIQTGKKYGMQTLNEDLLRLIQQGVVEAHEAHLKAADKRAFREMCERNGVHLG